MKNVLIISSSPNLNGNSAKLANEFYKGAKDAGNNVEIYNLNQYKINYCKSCWYCAKTKKCIQKDDFNFFAEKLQKADVVLFTTPTYFYNVSAQLKTFIDRTCSIYDTLKFDVYFFISANDTNEELLENTVNCFRGFSRDCLNNCQEKGIIKAGNDDPKPFLKTAYNFGFNC